MPSPNRPDTTGVVACDFSVVPSRAVRKSSLIRSLIARSAMLLLAVASVARADNTVGKWDPPAAWPIIAIHAVLMPDGRVLTYGTTETGQQTGFTVYDIWDPSAGFGSTAHATMPNTTGTDLFCSSQIMLPDTGNVLIAGGDNFVNNATTNTGNNNSNVFTPRQPGPPALPDQLARGNNMNRARWYSSSTTLLNGEIYVQGGTSGGDRPEVRGTNGVFRLLSSANTSSYAETFPRNFIAPDGRVFGFDNSGRMYYVVPSGTGTITPPPGQQGSVGQLPGATSWTSSAAMFRPGRILQMGGASNAALVIDINGATPVVTATQSMSSQRQWVSATVLPDGRVLATGGSQVDNALTNVNNSAEVWDPNGNGGTGKWTVGPSGVNARLYHSGALLLPDARVMITGGGAPGPLVNTNIEMYTPSYLLDANGNPMARPSITTALTSIEVGQSFSVGYSSPSSISRVTLVKTGSITHSVNMDQRFVELGFTANGAMLDVNGPVRATDTPPGYYLLFILNSQGVPSVGKIVRIGVAGNPNPTPDATLVIGGTGGTPFTLACNANEVLAGVYGTSDGTHVNQAGLRCIQVDQNGHWIGTPVNRGVTGVASGASYTKTCPTNYAISGYRGRSSTFADQLDFECRALTSLGKLTGVGQYLGAVGGSGGTAQGPYNCGTNNPVYALVGRSGSWLDNFGMQCRQASLTTVNSPPTIVNPGTLSGTVGVSLDVAIGASDPDGQAITFSASGLPNGLSISANTGHITGTPLVPGSFIVSITVTDAGNASSNTGFTWNINPAAPFVLNPLSPPTATLAGTAVSYTATSSNGINARYSWNFDDGSAQTAYSASPAVTHTFATPGIYYVTVTAIDDFTAAQTQTVAQTIYLAATANRPVNSGSIAYEQRSGSNSRVWVVNQDNDSVTAFDAVTNSKLAEIAVGTAPRSIARAPDGRLWATNKLSANITIINPNTLSVSQTVALPFASQPYGVVFAPTGGFAFVVLEALGRVLKLDASSGAQLGSVDVGPNPRHLAVSGDGATVLVSRFITPHLPGEETAVVQTQNGAVQYGGEVIRISAASMSVLGITVLRHSDEIDAENSGSGVPNYLGAPVISPDGTAAWVPSKQDNIKRGTLRNQLNLNFQNTVRAISSRIDLSTNAEDFASRLDHDNSSLASAVAFDKYGVYMFVALETSREVEVVDAHGRWEIFRFSVGRAPQGLAVSPDGLTLYVNNFMDRTVSVFDLSRLVNLGETNVPLLATLQAVTNDKLSAQVLKGKQFFYDALDPRLARDRYLSCASCHNDGGQDGRVWDLTGFGEGLRNTINLRGRAGAQGQGFLHWSGNFDEVQDFEGQIRNLSGGTGLMTNTDFNTGTRNQPLGDPKTGLSTDLDALAAYVGSLSTFTSSPLRNSDGTLTSDALAGKQIFRDLNCAQCHSGTAFTESAAANLRSIGTIKPSSGQRLGGPLTGIDTPTLRDVWATAPYLHDGSAATLGVAVRAHNSVSISDSDLAKVVAYLQQIGSDETAAPTPTNLAPTVTSPGAPVSVVGVALDLAITANDPNGDALTYSATGLPSGLNINPSTGHITGTPSTVNVYSVTVTATDPGTLSGSANFSWTISNAPDGTVPSTPTNLTASAFSATQINLSWTASTDNVGVTGYQIERCVGTGCSNFTALTTVSTTSYSNTGLTNGTSYSYRVRATDAAGNLSGFSSVSSATTPDTQAPTAPSGLTATALTSTQINLSWTAATDNVAVTGYQIERCQGAGCSNFAALTTVATTTYSNTGLTAGTPYSYRVRATDAAPNLGPYSNTASATTSAGGTPVTPAFKQTNNAVPQTPVSTVNVTFTAAQSAGDLNVVAIGWYDTTSQVLSVTDNRGNNYQRAAGPTTQAQAGTQSIYYAPNIVAAPAGGTTITVTFNAAVNYPDVRIAEYSGIDPLNPVDVSVSGTGSGATSSSGSVTTTNPNDLLIGANYVTSHTTGPGTGFTQRVITNPDGSILEDRVVTTAGSYSATAPLNTCDWIMQMVAFRAALSGPPDTSAPSTPANLIATATSSSQINLSWTASTDNVAVSGYQIERCQGAGCSNFSALTTVTTTSYSNTGLTASTPYSYRVRAIDGAGNTSGYSNVGGASTPAAPDTTAPTAPTNLSATPVSSSSINLSWTASTDNLGVTGYQVHRCQGATCTNYAQVGTASGTTYADGSLTAATTYRYQVRATDAAGNLSTFSTVVNATTQAGPDTAAPTVTITTPTSTISFDTSTSPLSLGGTAADAVGVTQVTWSNDRGGNGVASGTTSWSVTGIALQSGSNVLTVTARDAANNVGTDTLTVNYTPVVPDTQAPTAPSGLTATALTSTQINLSWTAATDNVAVTGYLIERCQGAGCSNFAALTTVATTTYSNTGLTAGTPYSYRVRATDAAPNLGPYSNTASATTAAGGTPVTPAFKQTNNAVPQTPVSTVNVTFTAAQSAGDLNVVAIGWYDTTSQVLSVTDNRGNNYQRAAGPTTQAQAGTQSIYYAPNIVAAPAGGTTITVTFNAAVNYPDVRIAEYSGIDPLNPVDVSVSGTGSGATSSSGSVTTTNPNDLLIGANYVTSHTTGPGTGFTQRVITNPDGSILEDRVVTTTGSYSATAALNNCDWIMQMVAFRAATQ